jgi:hypothetical protein
MDKRCKGYTVLEIMMTIFLLVLVCMTTATLLANAHKLNAASSRYVHAYEIGEAIIEELSSLPVAGGTMNLTMIAEDPSKWTPAVTIADPYFLPQGAVTLTLLQEGRASNAPVMARVGVTVAWRDRRGTEMKEMSVRLERLIPGNTFK